MRVPPTVGYAQGCFYPALPAESPPGGVGQYILWDQPYTFVGHRRCADRLDWPVDHLASRCVFDWAPGDGDTPAIGPELDITDGGGPNESGTTPWSRFGGSTIAAATFDGSAARRTSTQLDPSSGQDVRVLVLVWTANDRTSDFRRIFSTRNAGPGISIHYRGAYERYSFYVVDNSGNQAVNITDAIGWVFIDGFWDLDGMISLRVNGSPVASANSPGGDHGPGDGVGVGSFPDGSGKLTGKIARILVYYGSDLDNVDDHAMIAAHVLGVQNVQGDSLPTVIRSANAVKQVGSRFHVYGPNAARAGSVEGLLVEPEGENKCYNTINPQATTGWSITGGTHTVVDDSSALESSGLDEYGPQVHQIANSSGSTQHIYGGATTGSTNVHSLSVFARFVAGSGAKVGLRDGSTGTFAGTALADDYDRTLDSNRTPSDSDCQLALEIPDGCTVRFVLPQLEEKPFCTSPIPNVATAATAIRAADQVQTALVPRDGAGSIEVGVTPYLWSASEISSSFRVIDRVAASSKLLRLNSSLDAWDFGDGTATVSPNVTPTEGVRNVVRQRWGDAGISLDVDGVRDVTAYDGDLEGSGAVQLGPTSQGGVYIDTFRIFRGESG